MGSRWSRKCFCSVNSCPLYLAARDLATNHVGTVGAALRWDDGAGETDGDGYIKTKNLVRKSKPPAKPEALTIFIEEDAFPIHSSIDTETGRHGRFLSAKRPPAPADHLAPTSRGPDAPHGSPHDGRGIARSATRH